MAATKTITESIVDSAKYRGRSIKSKSGRAWTRDVRWDKQLIGFGLRIFPSNKKTYVVMFRDKGTKRMKTLGKVGVITLKEARKLCVARLKNIHLERYA